VISTKSQKTELRANVALHERTSTIALAALTVVLVAVACYYNTLSAGFVNWDDGKLITENPYVRGLSWENLSYIWTHPIKETYLPLRVTSYAADYALWGLNATGFHLTNIVLHALCALLVFFIARKLTSSLVAGFMAGALFAVHPVHTEAVAWASGRKDVLSTALFLLAYLLYLVSKDRKRPWPIIALSLIAFVLSGLAKAMVVTLPALVILTDVIYGYVGRERLRRLVPVWMAYFGAAAAVTLIAVVFAAKAHAIVPYHFGGKARTMLFMTWAALYYAKTMLFPDFLSARYPYGDANNFGVPDMVVYLSPIVLALVAAWAVWLVVKARGGDRGEAAPWTKLAALGVAWFLVSLTPVMNVVSINVLVADRYVYLPSVGFVLALAAVLWYFWARPTVSARSRAKQAAVAIVFVMILGADAARTYARNEVWNNSISLWTSVVSEFPGSREARLLLASAYADNIPPDYEKALAEISKAEALSGEMGDAHLMKGRIYQKMGKADLAKEELDKARALGVKTADDAYSMGMSQAEALEAAGDLAGAVSALSGAIASDPSRPEAYVNLGRLYEKMGQADKAESLYTDATRIDPKFAQAWYNLGIIAAQRQDNTAAEVYYSKALDADPSFAEAMVNLAAIRIGQGDVAAATPMLENATRLKPDLVPAHMNLSKAYTLAGDIAKARSELEIVLKIDPKNQSARKILDGLDAMTKGGR